MSGVCRMECLGDNYDVNSATKDGCEVSDAYAGHTTQAAAHKLADISDCTPFKLLDVPVPSDDVYHVKTKSFLKLGTHKWLKVHVDDKLLCTMQAMVMFDPGKLPAANSYGVQAKFVCDSGPSPAPATAVLQGGGKSQTFNLNPTCSSKKSGTLYLQVYKATGGAHSAKPMQVLVWP